MKDSTQTYTDQVLRMVVSQICHTIGFTAIQTTPMEVMVDSLHHYMREMSRLSKDYAELYNRTEPTVEDIELAFRDMKVNFSEITEYVQFVDPIPCPLEVPKYPLPKESHLNFLKPGSQEVITRPTHIPEYLPPMQPPEEEEVPPLVVDPVTLEEVIKEEPSTAPTLFKKPEATTYGKPKVEEEGKPTREMKGVMMTSSGFISPAFEGKLPDSKEPENIVPDRRPSPPPPVIPVAAPLPITSMDSKFEEKPQKKKHGEEKKVKKIPKKEILAAAGPSSSSSSTPSGPPKVLPPIPPHSIASTVTPSLPPIVKTASVKARKPGRPPKPRPDGTLPPLKPKKQKRVDDAEILTNLKAQMAAGKLPSMPESQLMTWVKSFNKQKKKSDAIATHSMIPSPLNQPFGAPQFGMPPKVEGKLPTEPEKSKLNIFKKIPAAKPPAVMDFPPAPAMIPKLEPDEHPVSVKKREPQLENPFNMSMGRGDLTTPKTPDFMQRGTSDVKTTPWVKEEKKRKSEKKPREKKQSNPLHAAPGAQPPMVPLFSQSNFPGLGGATLPGMQAFQSQQRFPFYLSNSPGLIPNHNFLGGPSTFGSSAVPPPFGLGNVPNPASLTSMFPALGHMQSRVREDLSPPIMDRILPSEKPLCNVPPLLPDVLPPETSAKAVLDQLSPILKLPPDTVAIPVPEKHEKPIIEIPPLVEEPPQHRPSTLAPTAGPSVAADEFDTIDLTSPVSAKSEKKKDKEHKKEKKDKDKMKKKKKQKDKDREKGEKDKEKPKKHKKEKKEKKDKERQETHKLLSSNTDSVDASDSSMASVPKLTLKLGISGSRSSTPDVPKKLSLKPSTSKKKDSDSVSDTFSDIGSSPRPNIARESSPELVKISALVTHPPKKHSHSPKKRRMEDENYEEKMKSPSKHKRHAPSPAQQPLSVADKPTGGASAGGGGGGGNENQVWICPACAQVDNGTPMIGCDGCDAWYHWVCVGIQVPPDDSEDWYCRACISRKSDSHGEKKKKRKKNKENKEKI